MPLNVTPEQQAFLNQVDTDLETAMSEGVAQTGVFLPPLPNYDKAQPAVKTIGRQGILSTFAALIKGLFDFQQPLQPIALLNGVGFWSDSQFRQPHCYKSAGNEVGLTGLITTPTISAYEPLGILPTNYRPSHIVITPVLKNGTPVALYINPNGVFALGVGCTAGEWISLDCRFRT